MALQIKQAGSADQGIYVKMLLTGAPGAGKTRHASTWPNVLIANCEGGMMSVADRGTNYVTISSSSDMDELARLLTQDAGIRAKAAAKILGVANPVPIDTVVIDTLDEYARILEAERLSQTRQETFQIKDWGWLGTELRNMVRRFRNMDINVIFTCHLKNATDEDTGSMFVKPGLKGGFADELAGYVDLAVLMTASPETTLDNKGNATKRIVRTFQTFPDKRHDWLKDRSGSLPLLFPINLEDDYERMSKLMFGDLEERKRKQQEAAQADLQHLAEELADAPETVVEADKVDPPVDTEPAVEAETSVELVPGAQQRGEAPAVPIVDEENVEKCVGGKEVSGVRNLNQMELAEMKFGEKLCRECFGDAKDGRPLSCGVKIA